MKTVCFILLVLFSFAVISCNTDKESFTFLTFVLDQDTEGGSGGFADYHSGEEEFFELACGYGHLPPPLTTAAGALMKTGNNHSDDYGELWLIPGTDSGFEGVTTLYYSYIKII